MCAVCCAPRRANVVESWFFFRRLVSSRLEATASKGVSEPQESFADSEGGIEMETRAIIKPKKHLPPKYAKSQLRVAFKPVDYSQGGRSIRKHTRSFTRTHTHADTVSVKLRCSVGSYVSEHHFSAKKSTLEGLGYANMEEGISARVWPRAPGRITPLACGAGVVELKDLVMLSMHFLVDDLCVHFACCVCACVFPVVKTGLCSAAQTNKAHRPAERADAREAQRIVSRLSHGVSLVVASASTSSVLLLLADRRLQQAVAKPGSAAAVAGAQCVIV